MSRRMRRRFSLRGTGASGESVCMTTTLAPVTLSGRRVRLEPLAERHAASLGRQGADPDVWTHMSFARLDSEAALQAWGPVAERELARGEGLTLAVVELASGEAVGTTSLYDFSAKDRRLEIGRTWLGKKFWRTAVNTECKRLLLGHAFETMGLLRVQLKTDGLNVRSQAAIARLGAVREGVLRAHMRRLDGTQRDTVMFSIIASEWPAVRARLDTWLARGPGQGVEDT
jgi:N-acetyltransferase